MSDNNPAPQTTMPPREFWLDIEKGYAYFSRVHKCVHVIEYSAFTQLQEKLAAAEMEKYRWGSEAIRIEELERKLEIAKTEIKRLLSANYHSLLEATAWMGIPEQKRENFIEQHLSNTTYIAEKALSQLGAKGEG